MKSYYKALPIFCAALLFVFASIKPAQTFTLGKKYDASNYQEIADLLPHFVLDWVKKGEFAIKGEPLEFEWKYDDVYLEASKKNEGKYDVDKNGILVDKKTQETVRYYYGTPFPTIDLKDPKIALKIMENNVSNRFINGAERDSTVMIWVGQGGKEREIWASGLWLYYLNRLRGPIPNPKDFQVTQVVYMQAPFDIRGVVQMVYTYNGPVPDVAFAYVPMLRRVRRMSAATRSDPLMGSDVSTDDSFCWNGRNASMKWRFLGKKTLLMPLCTNKKIIYKLNKDDIVLADYHFPTPGFQVSGWKGAPWAIMDMTWNPTEVYIVEAVPIDRYYNYGKMIFYINTNTYSAYMSEKYSWAGEYIKGIIQFWQYGEDTKGRVWLGMQAGDMGLDEKAHHANFSQFQTYGNEVHGLNFPLSELPQSYFTEAYLRQLSK